MRARTHTHTHTQLVKRKLGDKSDPGAHLQTPAGSPGLKPGWGHASCEKDASSPSPVKGASPEHTLP